MVIWFQNQCRTYSEGKPLSQYSPIIPILSVVLDSMSGDTEPIPATGETAARGRLVQLMHGTVPIREIQATVVEMFEAELLVVDYAAQTLMVDIDVAKRFVRDAIFFTDSHPSAEAKSALRTQFYELMDKVTNIVMGGFPTVTTWRPSLA